MDPDEPPTARIQPARINTTIYPPTSASAMMTSASPSSGSTPSEPVPAALMTRSTSTASRFSTLSKMSQGTRRSRFVEALDDLHDSDAASPLDQRYDVGRANRQSVLSIVTTNAAADDAASLRERRSRSSLRGGGAGASRRARSRSSSLGVETPVGGGGLEPLLLSAGGGAPSSGKRQVSFNFPQVPRSAASDDATSSLGGGTGTPTTPGYNDRTGGSNPFADVYGMDAGSVRSTTNLMGGGGGYEDYEGERTKGGGGVDGAKGMEEGGGLGSPKLAYFFERNPQQGEFFMSHVLLSRGGVESGGYKGHGARLGCPERMDSGVERGLGDWTTQHQARPRRSEQ